MTAMIVTRVSSQRKNPRNVVASLKLVPKVRWKVSFVQNILKSTSLQPFLTSSHFQIAEVMDLDSVRTPTHNPTEWWMQLVPEEELLNIENSGKLMVLLAILEECEAIGDKL
jgi:hypothetical protein